MRSRLGSSCLLLRSRERKRAVAAAFLRVIAMTTVFFDIDTQLDFLYPAGALYVPKAERIVPNIARLNRFAAARGFPVVSTTDAHTENDPEFSQWPPHCVAGTMGQRKPEATLLERRVVIPSGADHRFSWSANPEADLSGADHRSSWSANPDPEFDAAQQIVFEKRTVDVFQCANLPALLRRLNAGQYVVYGVVTEICVLHAARGLLKTGIPVTVVTDAVETLKAEDSARALAEIRAGGGTLATVADICG